VEHAVQHAGAARVGQEFAVIADQPARGHMRDDPRLAGAGGRISASSPLRAPVSFSITAPE
jgi:hypothetical protein